MASLESLVTTTSPENGDFAGNSQKDNQIACAIHVSGFLSNKQHPCKKMNTCIP